MGKDSPLDLFGAGSKKPLKPAKKASSTASSSTPTDPVSVNIPPVGVQPKKFTIDPEINKMLEQIFKMREDLQKKLDDIFQKTGLSRAEIESFLNNPNNYPPGKWEKFQNEKKLLEDKLYVALGIDRKHKAKQEDIKTAKERKGKFLGGRKNWIPIR